MRNECWALLHTINRVVLLCLWVAIVYITQIELRFEMEIHERTSYKTIEQMLATVVANVLFIALAVAHGCTNRRALCGQHRNPLMLRSGASQIIAVVYFCVSLIVLYFVLLNHADLAEEVNNSVPACAALQIMALLVVGLNHLVVCEQFSHPQLIYACDNDDSRERRRLQASSDGTEQSRPLQPQLPPPHHNGGGDDDDDEADLQSVEL